MNSIITFYKQILQACALKFNFDSYYWWIGNPCMSGGGDDYILSWRVIYFACRNLLTKCLDRN